MTITKQFISSEIITIENLVDPEPTSPMNDTMKILKIKTSSVSRLLFKILFVLIVSTFISCSREDEKTILLEVISELPISISANRDYFSVRSWRMPDYEQKTELSNLETNQIGENVIRQTFTFPPYTAFGVDIRRENYQLTGNDSEYIYYCGDVIINLYSNNVLFATDTLLLGGSPVWGTNTTCDTYVHDLYFTVPE